MTPIAPPTLAPKDVPLEAARYLDDAAAHLKALAKKKGLELKPYELHDPEHTSWFHGLYGESNEREICIRVMTDEELAPSLTADLIGYVRLHMRAGEHVFPENGFGDWIIFERRRVRGMSALVAGTSALTESLRLACVYRMPHPTSPDPKA